MSFTVKLAEHLNNYYDYRAGSFYDSFQLAAGMNVPPMIRLFTEPMSMHKTAMRTNMEQCGKLPTPTKLRIDRIVVNIPKVICEQDVMNLITGYRLMFAIGQKYYIREPLLTFLSHHGQMNLSPIRKCKACCSCYVELKCPHCGSPEFELFGEHDPTNPEYAGNVIRFIFDCSATPITLDSEWNFQCYLEGEGGYTLTSVANGGNGIKCWINLEGIVGRGVQ